MNGFFVNESGVYETECRVEAGLAAGLIQVPIAPVDARQRWDFGAGVWGAVPVDVPEQVDMRQARRALLDAGMLDQVETALAAMEGDAGRAARIDWDFARTVERNSPTLGLVAGALELTDAQLDQLFIAAALL